MPPTPTNLLAFLALLSAAPAAVLAQDPAPAPPVVEPAPDPAAQALWGRLQAATRAPEVTEPVTAFHVVATIRVRGEGVERNDVPRAEYTYLAPNYVRFRIDAARETGRGPGKGDAAYWMREKDRVTTLAGREFSTDRDLVRRMTSIARNFVALSNPAGLELSGLELLPKRPDALPTPLRVGLAKQLDWLAFHSPDFDLFSERGAPPQGATYRVEVGVDRTSHLPRLVTVTEVPAPDAPTTTVPMLFELRDFRGVDGTTIPHAILVHTPESPQPGARFGKLPAQEVYVERADLAPELTPESFLP